MPSTYFKCPQHIQSCTNNFHQYFSIQPKLLSNIGQFLKNIRTLLNFTALLSVYVALVYVYRTFVEGTFEYYTQKRPNIFHKKPMLKSALTFFYKAHTHSKMFQCLFLQTIQGSLIFFKKIPIYRVQRAIYTLKRDIPAHI